MFLMLTDVDGNTAEVDKDDDGFSGLMLNFPFLPLFPQFSMNNDYMTTNDDDENVDDDNVDLTERSRSFLRLSA